MGRARQVAVRQLRQAVSFRCALQPRSFQPVDLYDNAILHRDGHLAEAQAAQGVGNLAQRLLQLPLLPA